MENEKPKQNVFEVVNKIIKTSKTEESFGTNLVGEQLIISAYKTMSIDKLEKLRFIMNKIIKQKKEQKRINEAIQK
jgi:hypothetical protein